MTAPNRRWFRYGEPWGLFAKTNPAATPASTMRHTIAYGLVGVAIYFAMCYFVPTVAGAPVPTIEVVPAAVCILT